MKNQKAIKVNEKLGVKILNEDYIYGLKCIKYSKKEIKKIVHRRSGNRQRSWH